MSMFRNILTDLVEKKLWLPAAILVMLLVGVPMTLSKPGEPTEMAQLPNVKQEEQGPTLTLTRSSVTGFSRAPRVSTKQLDPFAPRGVADKKAVDKLADAADDVISGGGTTTDGGGDTGGGGVPNTPNTPSDPEEPKATEPETERDDVISVMFLAAGATPEDPGEAKELEDVRTLSPLPDADTPFLVYVGRAAGNGKAMFLVSADFKVEGGTCSPSPTDCRTLVMAIGDTAKFTPVAGGATVSMTLTDVETKDVPVSGDADTSEAAAIESQLRAVGAKALKSVLKDDAVASQLVKQKIKIRK